MHMREGAKRHIGYQPYSQIQTEIDIIVVSPNRYGLGVGRYWVASKEKLAACGSTANACFQN